MRYLIFSILMFLTCICSGQVEYPVLPDAEVGSHVTWTIIKQSGYPSKWSTYLIFDKTDVKSFEVDRKGKGFDVPDSKGRKVLAIITLKPGVKLMSLTELLRHFKIPLSDRKRFPIVVDGRYQQHPDHLYAVKTAVAYVKVETHSHTKKKVIYIRTNRPLVLRVGSCRHEPAKNSSRRWSEFANGSFYAEQLGYELQTNI